MDLSRRNQMKADGPKHRPCLPGGTTHLAPGEENFRCQNHIGMDDWGGVALNLFNVKTTWLILGVLGVLAVSSPAQTNFTIVTRTNIIQAAPNFREVNGQLYNSSMSTLWKVQHGKIADVQENGIVLQTFTTNNVYESVFVEGRGQPGSYSGTSDHYEKRLMSSDLVPAQRLFIKNYRIGAMDQEIAIPAMKTGTVKIGSTVLEEWDCGLPHIVTNIVSSKVAVK
jgi:hypothetical protein